MDSLEAGSEGSATLIGESLGMRPVQQMPVPRGGILLNGGWMLRDSMRLCAENFSPTREIRLPLPFAFHCSPARFPFRLRRMQSRMFKKGLHKISPCLGPHSRLRQPKLIRVNDRTLSLSQYKTVIPEPWEFCQDWYSSQMRQDMQQTYFEACMPTLTP